MYHFTADHSPQTVRLSFRAVISGHIRQYLKDFQIDAIRFMHNYLAKGEFCVYNDESGLGKQASVAVLLDAACSSKKCLIVVQNDDRYVNGWEFHFNVLTNFNVMVIKDGKDSTDTPHNIYIAKWSTLRAIDDLSKFKFDYIIIDNRGQMLNNSFCTSMLLKHYERKINILISSVDITSDLKLLHNVLRLGGRLDPQYSSFKIFEEKFKLPDAKELAYKKVDLEEYFCKRERLANYCKNFRLRRYCHQFENALPLVKEDRYKINLDIWREKQNATNSESSSIEFVNNQQREDERVKDTQELFEEYCRQRKKEHLQFRQEQELLLQQREREALKKLQAENEIIYNIDDEEVASINATPPTVVERISVTRDNSDEPVLMSPLLVVSDSEDSQDQPQICNDPNDDIEIVDLSNEEKDDDDQNHDNDKISKNAVENKKVNKNGKWKKRTEVDRLAEDIVDELKLEQMEKKRPTRHAKDDGVKSSAKRLKDRLQDKNIQHKLNSNGKPIKSTKNKKENNEKSIPPEKDKTPKKSSAIKTNENVEKQLAPDNQITTNNNNNKSSNTKDQETNKNVQKPVNENDKTPTNSKKILKEKQKSSTGERAEVQNNEGRHSKSINKVTPTKDKSPNNTTTAVTPLNSKSNSKVNSRNDKGSNDGDDVAATPVSSTKTRSIQKTPLQHKQNNNKTPTIKSTEDVVVIKEEPTDYTTPETKTSNVSKYLKVKSEKARLKREMDITPSGVHHKETRSMQRLTRSGGGGSKYLTKNLSLQIDKIIKPKKKITDKQQQQQKTDKQGNKPTTPASKAKTTTPTTVVTADDKSKEAVRNTQASIISHRSSQDYESIQCAQRLSGGIFSNNTEFLVPPTPTSNIMRNSLIPSSLTSSNGFFTESDIIFVPPSNPVTNTAASTNKKRDIILLSSSDNENSTSQSSSNNFSSTSRRTRALKPRRVQQNSHNESSKIPTFSELLAQQNTRTNAKSPDLFSNCSDLAQLPCSQPNVLNTEEEPNTPFEGFKIFGSEVKQLQQHYASSAKNNTNKSNVGTKKSYRDRSCLDILEKMFEPPATSSKKQKSNGNDKSQSTPTKRTQRGGSGVGSAGNKSKTQQPILPSHPIEAITEAQNQQQKRKRTTTTSSGLQEDEIFEITNNGTFGSVMRLHSNGDISPVQQTQKANATQNNKITNYLIGNLTQNAAGGGGGSVGNGSQEDQLSSGGVGGCSGNNITEAGTPSKRQQQQQLLTNQQNANLRKSPKGKCTSTQATKLTKWFTKPSESNALAVAAVAAAAAATAKNTKKSPTKQAAQTQPRQQQEVDLTLSSTPPGKRVLKRRRLDLAFSK